MKKYVGVFYNRFLAIFAGLVILLCISLSANSSHLADALANEALPSTRPLLAYNIDLGMDRARGEQTIEYYGETYGEPLRDIVEQTIRNNENHPEKKSTAKNSYKRESTLNNVLPEKRNSAFSQDTLSKLRKTKNPKDVLK